MTQTLYHFISINLTGVAVETHSYNNFSLSITVATMLPNYT